MYIRNLHVANLKLCRELELSFERDGEPRMWTVLLGENGLCKTTLLQAIAMAASGETRANQLADVPGLKDLRVPGRMDIYAVFTELAALRGIVSQPPVNGVCYVSQSSGSAILRGLSGVASRSANGWVSHGIRLIGNPFEPATGRNEPETIG